MTFQNDSIRLRGAPCTPKAKNLEGHIDPYFRSFDTGYPDQNRADRFIDELHRFEKEGDMPRLQIIRLPNDHTAGTRVGMPTPNASVADNTNTASGPNR